MCDMFRAALRAMAAAMALLGLSLAAAARRKPIKVGFSMALTGAVAPNGKQLLTALEIWRDDVNAKGGLLGRPVELVYYDDQSNPSNVPGIYAKLIGVDKVDLLVGPYATNMAAPAMPVIMQNNKMTISMMAIGVNRHFNYPKYFSMVPIGPEGVRAFSQGFFELAAAQNPKPQTRRLPGGRRGIRPHRRRRRQGECQGGRLQHHLRPRPIRRPPPTFCPSCARCRRPMPTWCSSPPIRPTRSASCGRRARSG